MDNLTRPPGEAPSSGTLMSSGADRARAAQTWLVLLLGSLAMIPIAMSGVLAIAGLSVFRFYASRGDEPLFGPRSPID